MVARSDTRWMSKQILRRWRTRKMKVTIGATLHELNALRVRNRALATEVQEWRNECMNVSSRHRTAQDLQNSVRLRLSNRGVIPARIDDDDLKDTPEAQVV